MNRTWVLNASPLIFLGKLSLLSTLESLCSELVIPEAVAGEIRRGPNDDPSRVWLSEKGTEFVTDPLRVDPAVAAWDLGLGENQVISLARAIPEAEAIVDDRAARQCAASLGIPVRGTLGVLLLAKRKKQISAVRPLLRRLMEEGYRIEPQIVDAALELVNEK